ncbi:MAG: hypothetical protein R2828_29585 [Saprospiraceae bacterium]
MNNLEKARSLLKKHLLSYGFDPNSIRRIVEEDLAFLTTWELPPDPPEKISKAEAIISFSFGYGPAKTEAENTSDQYDPLRYFFGKTNEALAETILKYSDGSRPVFAQWEIAEALKERGEVLPAQQVAKPGETYLGTSSVVKQFIDNGLDQFKSVLLIAHKHHAFRCREITRNILKEMGVQLEITIPILPGVYDSTSVQPWTRSLKDWVEYEVGNRFQNRYRGIM